MRDGLRTLLKERYLAHIHNDGTKCAELDVAGRDLINRAYPVYLEKLRLQFVNNPDIGIDEALDNIDID